MWRGNSSRSLRLSRPSRITAVGTTLLCLQLIVLAPAALAQGNQSAASYLSHCAGCHLPDGTGLPPEVPNLGEGFSYLLGSPEGRDFITRVPGVIGAPLPAADIAELLNWMVGSFYPDAEDFTPFTVDDILRGKKQPLHDPMKYRKQLFPEY